MMASDEIQPVIVHCSLSWQPRRHSMCGRDHIWPNLQATLLDISVFRWSIQKCTTRKSSYNIIIVINIFKFEPFCFMQSNNGLKTADCIKFLFQFYIKNIPCFILSLIKVRSNKVLLTRLYRVLWWLSANCYTDLTHYHHSQRDFWPTQAAVFISKTPLKTSFFFKSTEEYL